jgi:hypothetical protein
MISIRHSILAALENEPMVLDGLLDETGIDRKRLSDNLSSAFSDKLVSRSKDSVTGMLLYTITAAGRKRLAEGPQSGVGVNVQKNAETSRIEPYDEIDASVGETVQEDEEMPPANASLLASANSMLSDRLARVAHALRGSGLPGLATIDDGEDLQCHVAALAGAYQTALSELNFAKGNVEAFRQDAMRVNSDRKPKSRKYHGYACIVDAEIFSDEALAIEAAEVALLELPAGKIVSVVAITDQAENVLRPKWKIPV